MLNEHEQGLLRAAKATVRYQAVQEDPCHYPDWYQAYAERQYSQISPEIRDDPALVRWLEYERYFHARQEWCYRLKMHELLCVMANYLTHEHFEEPATEDWQEVVQAMQKATTIPEFADAVHDALAMSLLEILFSSGMPELLPTPKED